MALSAQVSLSGIKGILSLHIRNAARLSDAELTAKLETGLLINDATNTKCDKKATRVTWIDLKGNTCIETFPRGLQMGEGKWRYRTVTFKPTPKFFPLRIDVAHLEGAHNLSVELHSRHLSRTTEVLFHCKMDCDATGWDKPVHFTLTSPVGDVKLRCVKNMQEYINKPGYHYISVGSLSQFGNIDTTGTWVAKMSTTDGCANYKKGLTIHGICLRTSNYTC